MLYLVFGLLALGALGALAYPLFRFNPSLRSRRTQDLTVYRDQLHELEREIAEGRLGEGQARIVRAEIERRILSADRQEGEAESGTASSGPRAALAAGLGLVICLGAAGLYSMLGSPSLPGQPSAGRFDSAEALEDVPVSVLVDRLAARLKTRPDDVEGWTLLGRTAMSTGRFDLAERAFVNLARLQPDQVEPLVQLAQSRLALDDGLISPDVKVLFDEVLRRDPAHPAPRYYLALHDFQAGRYQAAHDGWMALSADTPPGAPWQAAVARGIQQSRDALGIAAPGPSADQVEAAGAMSGEERRAMIAGMVEGLAARLEEDRDDLDGWKRLARAYAVLGQRDETVRANENILRLDEDDASALAALAEAAELEGDSPKALELWTRLLSQLPKESPQYQQVNERIEALRGR